MENKGDKKREFMQQYVLSRASTLTVSISAYACVTDAERAYNLIERSCEEGAEDGE